MTDLWAVFSLTQLHGEPCILDVSVSEYYVPESTLKLIGRRIRWPVCSTPAPMASYYQEN